MPVVTKASAGVQLAFPEVCRVPAPAAGLTPLPYPAVAKTANAAQKTAVKSTTVSGPVTSSHTRVSGDEAGVAKAMASSKLMADSEIAALKSAMNALHNQIQSLKSSDPNKWQDLLKEYLLAASALYVTLTT